MEAQCANERVRKKTQQEENINVKIKNYEKNGIKSKRTPL